MLSMFKRAKPQKPPRVFVHIGQPKCGSTTLQRHFAMRDQANRKRGLVYPKQHRTTTGYKSHAPLVRAKEDAICDMLRDIAAEAQDAQQILISTEAVAAALPFGKAEALAVALDTVFGRENVTIVAYFRNAYSFIESSYAQLLTGGLFGIRKTKFFRAGQVGIDPFLTAFETRKGFAIYDYVAYCDAISHAFPGFDLSLRSLDRTDLGGQDLLEDMYGLLDLSPAKLSKSLNERVSTQMLLAVQFVQLADPGPKHAVWRKEILSQASQWIGPAWPKEDDRHIDLHMDTSLQDRVSKALEPQRSILQDRFATPVDGLFRRPAATALSSRLLSDDERATALKMFHG